MRIKKFVMYSLCTIAVVCTVTYLSKTGTEGQLKKSLQENLEKNFAERIEVFASE